jgi:ubiquinone/menaquinone biosynthesis C-methylase UbiE
MSLCPSARQKEFSLAIEAAQLENGDMLCDAPSGGGYLSQYLPQDLNLQVVAVDPSEGFSSNGAQVVLAPLDDLPLKDGSCDAVLSVAGLHHVEDRLAVFSELRRVVRTGGRLCILEVARGSISDPFLNEFVDSHCSTGHVGRFVDQGFRVDLNSAGFMIRRDQLLEYSWCFESEEIMSKFVRLLFGLDKASLEEVRQGISHYLGYKRCDSGGCDMNWALQAIVCV